MTLTDEYPIAEAVVIVSALPDKESRFEAAQAKVRRERPSLSTSNTNALILLEHA